MAFLEVAFQTSVPVHLLVYIYDSLFSFVFFFNGILLLLFSFVASLKVGFLLLSSSFLLFSFDMFCSLVLQCDPSVGPSVSRLELCDFPQSKLCFSFLINLLLIVYICVYLIYDGVLLIYVFFLCIFLFRTEIRTIYVSPLWLSIQERGF